MNPKFPEIVGVTEVCAMLNCSRQQLARLRKHDFPAPQVRLANGPIWHRADIYEYLDTWAGFRPGGRPKKPSSGAILSSSEVG